MSGPELPRVSLTLQKTLESRAIVEAIQADNEEARVGEDITMIKIDCPGRLVIRAESVAERLGRPWETEEIYFSMVDVSGALEYDEVEILLVSRPL